MGAVTGGPAPDEASALTARGAACAARGQLDEALACYERALALAPGIAAAAYNRGTALQALGRLDAALADYDRALALDPGFAEAHLNRGGVLQALRRPAEACASLERALALAPGRPWLLGAWLHARMRICDWRGAEAAIAELRARIAAGEPCTPPFAVLALLDDPALQRRAAERWSAQRQAAGPALPPLAPYPRRERVRIGYFSADFHDHATSRLMAEVLELHDRARFELVAFSFGPRRDDPLARRVAAAFDRMVDVRQLPDREVALLARRLEVDVAVDLKGATEGERAGIFAARAAPLQVAYLGYPGTSGAAQVDYLLADRVVVPAAERAHCTERVVWLPRCYQANDRQRAIAPGPVDRAALGLPREGFVFCCFNNGYKVLPETFDGWMRILGQVEGSVLWLLEDSAEAAANLRRAAAARGVAPARLVFAPRLPPSEHLARHAAADLFLDTFPCNAHTTASDALWAGLPLITRAGRAFAARVAASLLAAVGLPELAVERQEDYEALAVALARDPARLAGVRRHLVATRDAAPLFDAPALARQLEAAYLAMLERQRAGLPPAHLEL